MPTISINKAYFYKLLGKSLTDAELEQICFDFGLETEPDPESDHQLRVEIPANRYDLLCVEGLANALGIFLGTRKHPHFTREKPHFKLKVEKSVKSVRPFAVGGVLRNIHFNEDSFKSFIDFQDKLHHSVGRKRTLVSIGTHDLDKIEGDFHYCALPKNDFEFTPLNQAKSFKGADLLEFYKKDNYLKNFLHIIEKSEVIPLIKDKKDRILSMPPIINSEFSKMDVNTKNVFIEITATDKQKALIALNLILANFSQYCAKPYSFEAVEIVDETTFETPSAELIHKLPCKKNYLESLVGLKFAPEKIVSDLLRMCYPEITVSAENPPSFLVSVPFYRSDVMHQCDIAEDLAISAGYNNIPDCQFDAPTYGKQYYLNKVSEQMRTEMAAAGFLECLNFTLCSHEDLTTGLLKKTDDRIVEIENPKTKDFCVGRTTLIPGLIKVLVSNKSNKLPIKIFELGDVILLCGEDEGKNKKHEVDGDFGAKESLGARNERRLAVAYSNSSSSGLEIVHGALDLIFTRLFPHHLYPNLKYTLEKNNEPYFFAQLQAKILIGSEVVGEMGIINPEILAQEKWPNPVSVLELNFELLANLHKGK